MDWLERQSISAGSTVYQQFIKSELAIRDLPRPLFFSTLMPLPRPFSPAFMPLALVFSIILPCEILAATNTMQPAQAPARVVVSGAVPDEVTKSKILTGVRRIYGEDRVVDQISVGNVQSPPEWAANAEALITPHLKSVSKGTLAIEGTTVSIRGEVPNESIRQGVENQLTGSLLSRYTLKNGLRVSASSQALLDRTLDGRVIEFENGSALITASGMRVLNEMAEAMKKISVTRIEVIGHTDSVGNPASNLALSRARADSVKTYLIRQGIAAELITTSGMGADQPVATNSTEDGRKRNRRIEFRAAQ